MRTTRRCQRERGAAAVEFALVVPLLLLLLFGIVDYGAVFADSVSNRNGVRETARQGVVSNFGGGTLSDLREKTKSEVSALSGTTSAKVYVPGGVWEKGARLIVCSKVSDPGLIKLAPLPASLKSRVEMSIENEASPPTGSLTSADAGDWSWC